MRDRPNVVIVVVDSLRADRLGCMGYTRPTTPFLDRFAESATLFTRFFANVVSTVPSCSSLLTGTFPLTHGVIAREGQRLRRGGFRLAEALSAQGYETAAIDNLAVEHRWFGRGFSTRATARTRKERYPNADRAVSRGVEWLRKNRERPFLLYYRCCEPHTPYAPPEDLRQLFYEGDPTVSNVGSLDAFHARLAHKPYVAQWIREAPSTWPGATGPRIEDIEWVRAQYDACVRAADRAIEHLVEELSTLGLLERTGIVVLGDHGESLGEHGIYFDHHGLYDTNLHTPLLVRWPGARGGRRVDASTQMPDIAPTLLELLGIPCPPGLEGRSAAASIVGPEPHDGYRKLVALEATWMYKWALRREPYKLIVARAPDIYGGPPVELYDLVRDPAEVQNLAGELPHLAQELGEELGAWIARRLRETGHTRDPVEHLSRRHNPRLLRELGPGAGSRTRSAPWDFLRRLLPGRPT